MYPKIMQCSHPASTFRSIVGHREHKSGECIPVCGTSSVQAEIRGGEEPPPQISGEIEMSPHTQPAGPRQICRT